MSSTTRCVVEIYAEVSVELWFWNDILIFDLWFWISPDPLYHHCSSLLQPATSTNRHWVEPHGGPNPRLCLRFWSLTFDLWSLSSVLLTDGITEEGSEERLDRDSALIVHIQTRSVIALKGSKFKDQRSNWQYPHCSCSRRRWRWPCDRCRRPCHTRRTEIKD